MQHVSVTHAQALRHLGGVYVTWCEIGCCGIVRAEPQQGANLVRKEAAGLGHEPESGLLGSDCALIDIGHAVHLEAHRPPAVWAGIAARASVGAHIHRGTLVVVAHHVGHVLGADLARRLHEQRHLAAEFVAHRIIDPVRSRRADEGSVLLVGEGPVAQYVECRPSPCIAGPGAREVERIVGIAEAEILVLALVPALAACEVYHVRRVEAVLRVIEREAGDAALVRVGAYVSVRHPARYPYYALFLTLADEVHDPRLLGIRDGEGLAFGRVAVGIRQLHDSADGLARGAGTLQGHVDQRTIVHHTILVDLLFAAAPGGFGYYELVLVHVAHDLEGLRHLRDLPGRAVGVPFGDREHRASLPFGCRVEVELAVEHVRVGGI